MKRICKTCDINELPKGKQYCGDCAEKSKIRICKNCGVIKLPKGKQYCDDCVHDDERQAKLPSSNKVYIYSKTPRICPKCNINESPKGLRICYICKPKTSKPARICPKCNINESPKGLRICYICKPKEIRKLTTSKPARICPKCDEIKLSKNKLVCDSCRLKIKEIRKLTTSKPARICLKCNINELPKGKQYCGDCKKSYVKSTRVVKVSITIPDHITDYVERQKYYKKEYAKIHHQKYFVNTDKRRKIKKLYNARKIAERKQEKLNQFNKNIDNICEKYNLNRDMYLSVRDVAIKRKKNVNFYNQNNCKSFDEYVVAYLTCCCCKELTLNSRYLPTAKIPGVYCKKCFKPAKKSETTKEDVFLRVKNKLLKLYANMDLTFKWETYKNRSTPMTVICKKHGEFHRKPNQLFDFTHCPECKKPNKLTREYRIKESITKFGHDKFDYSKFEYTNNEIKSVFICKKHNREFEQNFKNHIKGKVSCIDCRTELGRIHDYSKMGFLRIKTNTERDLLKYKNKLRNRVMNGVKSRIKQVLCDVNYKLKPSDTFDNIIGLDVIKFKEYIESKWEPWMNWENYGLFKSGEYNVGWDFDHIIPVSTSYDKESTLKLWHYTNLQPLCSRVNRYDKRNKLDY
jgi:hypothetical protein